MEKKKRPEPDDKEQSARFIEIAKQIKEKNTGKNFEKTCTEILKQKSQKKKPI